MAHVLARHCVSHVSMEISMLWDGTGARSRCNTLFRRNRHAVRRHHIGHGPFFENGARCDEHTVPRARGEYTPNHDTPHEYHQHTWPADLCLAETGKTQKELRRTDGDRLYALITWILQFVGHQTMKIVEDWLLALRPTYLVHPGLEPKDHTQGQIALLLEDRQIQVIEEQATGEAQRWEAIPLPHRRETHVWVTDTDRFLISPSPADAARCGV